MAKVAVVEDNTHVRRFMQTLLKLRGHEVSAYENGELALKPALSGVFDLIVSDVQMPLLDGISLCRAIREKHSKLQLPVILVSVLDAEDDILRALEAGANDYLVKPCSSALVSAKVSYHLKRKAEAPPEQDFEEFQPGTPPRFPCVFDKYILRGKTGSGAYGVVYLATRRSDGYKLALKVLDPSLNQDREGLARYFREVAALADIDNPHVVGFIDSGHHAGAYYLGMELVRGNTLWDQIYKGAPLSIPETVRLAYEMASALNAIHERGLVHRDVKSANIIAATDNRYILIDFGLAKGEAAETLTNPDEFLGTAEFIAPEVVTGDLQHIGSDIYALGVTLYEALTAALPFTGETAYEILRSIASLQPAAPVHMLRDDVPPAVSSLVSWLMHPRTDRRPSEPGEVLEKLAPMALAYPSPSGQFPPRLPGRRRR
ncbi:MAG: protein kinase [Planctomycetes bacterium]|nr:protein kinase [Planctomycetota bacterium]